MDVYKVDTIVIGAGVIGLAVARQLAISGREVWLFDKEQGIGTQTSSRNSEVIHAGIYYPQDSLKARLCVRGKALLYDYCAEKGVAAKQCGKLIVATEQTQVSELQAIQAKAALNGVHDLTFLDSACLHELEPHVAGVAGLLSPSTGILDSHGFMTQLSHDFQNAGGQLILNTQLRPVTLKDNALSFELIGQDACVEAKQCVNAAGHQATSLFSELSGFPRECLPKSYFAKGSYFSYGGSVPFQHLIYPVPEPGGLGVHLTLDLANAARFGPDVEWLDAQAASEDHFDYQVSPGKAQTFATAIKRYWPTCDETKLVPDYSGIRPKLVGPGEPNADFLIQDERRHGIKGLVNLLGIESPGLTASLAIAELVGQSIS